MRDETFLNKFLTASRIYKVKKYLYQNSILYDIGCGDGRLLKKLSADILKGIGIDKEIESINSGNLEFYNLDLNDCKLPSENNSVDIVLMLAVIEHLEKPENIIMEVHRILKAGGLLLMTTPSPRAKPVLDFLAFNLGIISKSSIAEHKQYFSKDRLHDLLFKYKFRNFIIKPFQLGFNLLCVAKK